MKETKFIELMNLYVNQQITPADAIHLEEEILTDPKRRAVYKQYCQMHRACALLQENLEVHAGEPSVPAAGDYEGDKVVEFPAKSRSGSWFYAVSGLAAAACLTFLIVRSTDHKITVQSPSAAVVALDHPTAVQPPALAARTSILKPAGSDEERVVINTARSSEGGSALATRSLVSAERPSETDPTFAAASKQWLGPLPSASRPSPDSLVFGVKDSTTPGSAESRYYLLPNAKLQSNTERTAYQFQR